MRDLIDLVKGAQQPEEQLDEVSRVPQLDRDDETFEEKMLHRKFQEFDPAKIGDLGSYEFWLAETPTENLYAFAVDAWGNPVGYLDLQKIKPRNYQVHMIYVSPEQRGNNLAYLLYIAILKRGMVILSDTDQTPGGRAIWRQLARDNRVQLYGVNQSDQVRPIDDPEDYYDDRVTMRFRAVWKK